LPVAERLIAAAPASLCLGWFSATWPDALADVVARVLCRRAASARQVGP
jgi:hypothetical protein